MNKRDDAAYLDCHLVKRVAYQLVDGGRSPTGHLSARITFRDRFWSIFIELKALKNLSDCDKRDHTRTL